MSKRIPFNIKYRPQIESGEYKVETNFGSPVEIVCWNRRDDTANKTIVGIIRTGTVEEIASWNIDGKLCDATSPQNTAYDLFIITPEEELTEFEQEVSDIVEYCKENGEHVAKGYAKRHAKTLLSFAEKELAAKYKVSSDMNSFAYGQGYKTGMEDALKERSRNITANLLNAKITGIQHELVQFASNIMEAGWKDIIEAADSYAERIKAHVLKDLPRWREIGQGNNYSSETKFCINGRYLEMNDTLNRLYEISLKDLEKLPKE